MNDVQFAKLESRMEAMAADVREIKHDVQGNGKPGLKMQVDRLERNWAIAAWAAGLAFTASVGLLIKAFWDSIKAHI